MQGKDRLLLFRLLLIYVVGLVGSSFGTLVGGSGLIVVPTLIFLGLSPQSAIATSQFGGAGSAIFGLYEFNRKKLLDVPLGGILAVTAVLGAWLGARIMLRIDPNRLRLFVAGATVAILILFFFKPQAGIQSVTRKRSKRRYALGLPISFLLGVYGGFYGVNLGTFLSYLLILVFGQTFLESAATRKIIGLLLILVAIAVFAAHHVIHYGYGAFLFAGSGTGSYLGAHFSDRIGNVWIRRLFFVVVFILALKLLL